MINLDHAATTPLHPDALDAMLPYFGAEYANASGNYADARRVRRAVDEARREVADGIGGCASEIYFTSGGTEADNWAILGSAFALNGKRHLITSRIEHHAVLHACAAAERFGFDVTYLDVDDKGTVSAEAVRSAMRADTGLVSVMLANNEVGTIEPIREISEVVHNAGALMHTDAVQAVGHIPVDVHELGVDLLSLSGHKFGGPKGVGALYIRAGVRVHNILFGGAQERGKRPGTENTPAIVGMGKAIRIACDSLEENQRRTAALRDRLQEQAKLLPGVRINGNIDCRLPGHLHLSVNGFSSQMILTRLDMMGIAASAGSACASGALERSHVIAAMGIADENQADIRFSIGHNNTLQEIDAAAQALRSILCK